jgi:hypothetical protein
VLYMQIQQRSRGGGREKGTHKTKMRFQCDGSCGILSLFGSWNFYVLQVLLFRRDHENFPRTFMCSHKCEDFARCDTVMYMYFQLFLYGVFPMKG